MHAFITGATGMVGKGVLLECLDHPEITKVTCLGRSTTGLNHPKLNEIIHTDFNDYTAIADQLIELDACFLCMGISSAGLSETEYHKYTYDYTINLAKIIVKNNPNCVCTYVSGAGTDSNEKSKTMWARVKGKTENRLRHLGFKAAFMFRPGVIIPLRGIKSKTKLYQFIYDYFLWLVKVYKFLSQNSVVNTTQIGQAMINATLKGYSQSILDPIDIIHLSDD